MWEKRVEPNSGTAHVAKCFPKIIGGFISKSFSLWEKSLKRLSKQNNNSKFKESLSFAFSQGNVRRAKLRRYWHKSINSWYVRKNWQEVSTWKLKPSKNKKGQKFVAAQKWCLFYSWQLKKKIGPSYFDQALVVNSNKHQVTHLTTIADPWYFW